MTTARRLGLFLAGGLVAAFLIWGVAGGWAKAGRYPWQIDWPRLALAVIVLALFNFAWGLGYARLLEAVSGQRGQQWAFLSIWARSLLGRYVPGNVLMFAGRVVFGRDVGVPARASLAASGYEQVAMLVVAALAASGVLLLSGRSWPVLFWLAAAVPLAVVLIDPAFHGVANRLLTRLGRRTMPVGLTRRQVVFLLGWFSLTMAVLAVGVSVGVEAVAGGRAGSVTYVGLGFLLAWVVSMLAFVFPSGLGVREAAFAVVLARHLPDAAAVSLAAASRLLLTAVELGVVAVVVVARRRRRAGPTGPAGLQPESNG